MRILQSITYYLPYVSGIIIHAKRLGEELLKRGVDVNILTSHYDRRLQLKEKQGGIDVLRVPVLFSIGKGPIMPLWPIVVWKEIGRADTVLVHLPQFEGIATAILAKIRGRPLIVIYHCEVTLPKGLVNSVVERALGLSQWATCKLADRIVVYTKDYAKYSYYLRWFKHKLVQIYPPIKAQSVKRKAQSGRLKRLKNIRGVKIGFAGRISEEKGLEYLIEASQIVVAKLAELSTKETYQSRPLQLIVAGPEPVGEREYVRKIKRLVKQIEEDVVFLGNLGQEELASFYKQIDILVLPSVSSTEAFGLVQVEAMLCGTPVVATDLPGVRIPIQKTGMGEIIPIKDSNVLAKAILKVLQNRKKYIKPRPEIEKIFSFKETIDSYERLFSNACEFL